MLKREVVEVALYRITQLLSLILDIPASKVNEIIIGSSWDVIEFYDTMLKELGGRLEGRFVPKNTYQKKRQLVEPLSWKEPNSCTRGGLQRWGRTPIISFTEQK